MLADAIKPLALTALAAVFATCHQGCSGVPLADQYKAAQLACVQQAKTLEESKSCRATVNRAYGVCEGHWPRYVPCADGGTNGGKP